MVAVSAIDRKLLRDLFHMKGQVVTIALVVACGISSYAAIQGTYYSLLHARDAYYERYRFADVFAHIQHGPDSLRERIAELPGIAHVTTRVLERVSLPIEGLPEPATGHIVSLPSHGEPALGGILLRAGRMFEPGRSDEVVLLEAFANAQGLRIGDRLPAVIGGIQRDLRIVGTALAPEYVFSVSPGDMMPDPGRFAVLWMDSKVVAAAFRMEGAWNDLLVRLQPGASEPLVIERLNGLLEAYGSQGAYGRDRQLSNNVLRGELAQLQTLTTIMPIIFLGVAAFLINVVLARLVQLQRGQIATLKAVGYRNRDVGLHYLKLVSVLVSGGAVLGVGVGIWIGGMLTDLYTRYFHFPSLTYRIDTRVMATAVLSSLLAAVVGALSSVRLVMQLPPAEAMRPETPTVYRRAITERLRLTWLFGQSARMVLRELERRPIRTMLSSLGVAMSVAVLVSGRFGYDAVDWFMHVQFERSQREDISVTFRRNVPGRALGELAHLPGVLRAEGLRSARVRFRSAHHSRESVIFGHPQDSELRRVVDRTGTPVPLPEDGLLITSTLADLMELHVGDKVTVEVLEGQRGTRDVMVAGLVDEVFGLFGHMRAAALDGLLREQGTISAALLRIDPNQREALSRALRSRPEVLGIDRRDNIIEMFRRQTAGQMRFTTLILTLFAAIIASGVIYNNARIVLSTRGRDLASLRVLGFRQAEISAILLGELAIQVALAIAPGMYLGGVIARRMMAHADPEMYRFPVVISAQTYAFAILVTLGASVASALVVRHRLEHLDLIAVLKSRE